MPVGNETPIRVVLEAQDRTQREMVVLEQSMNRLDAANARSVGASERARRSNEANAGSVLALKNRVHELEKAYHRTQSTIIGAVTAIAVLKEAYEVVTEGVSLFNAKLKESSSVAAAVKQYKTLEDSVRAVTAELEKQGKISPAKAEAIMTRLGAAKQPSDAAPSFLQRVGMIAGGVSPTSDTVIASKQKVLHETAIQVAELQRTTEKPESAAVVIAQGQLRLEQIQETVNALTKEKQTEDDHLKALFRRKEEIFKQEAELQKAAVKDDENASDKKTIIDIELQKKLLGNEREKNVALAAVRKLRQEDTLKDAEAQKSLDEATKKSLQEMDQATFDFDEKRLRSSFDRKTITAQEFHDKMVELIQSRAQTEIDAIDEVENRDTEAATIQLKAHEKQIDLEDELNRKAIEDTRKDADLRYQIKTEEMAATTSILGSAADAAKLFGQEGFIAYKAFAIAQAIVATALAIVKALAEVPYPANIIAAIAAGAAGAVQIATIAATQPGYARGGFTGGGRENEPVGIVHAREFVIPANVVADWGAAHFEAYRRGMNPFVDGVVSAVPNWSGSFQAGGFAPPMAMDNETNVNVGMINSRQEMRRFQEREGLKIIVDQMNRRGNRIIR